eukprot:CAMPEP_0116944622 /NCGR_PEP_ID=MMETSP0467-20121206/35870_1 /TAXON_ID=283647 /ORGANISM="Mesodinium pulex, Strain SPMC105" /LENGTH=88 /DNA_ID=CAMNT_0004627985 /DNA_START=95 /DNA_END=361 /DNA_ORIENTATION=-
MLDLKEQEIYQLKQEVKQLKARNTENEQLVNSLNSSNKDLTKKLVEVLENSSSLSTSPRDLLQSEEANRDLGMLYKFKKNVIHILDEF